MEVEFKFWQECTDIIDIKLRILIKQNNWILILFDNSSYFICQKTWILLNTIHCRSTQFHQMQNEG